ncbi:hypothetical protein [Deinococcus ruber]|uniref:Uncharacterized protein n=1 Tax=Deinococcus ruber TaxID=1848197 RepID=A0A918CK38_9DEIO|nr:hypothetical protein [Deinococcus ruber]GGR27267.1 hypothetical protein GCM10008957_43300 [Deinococcus ruber]
MLYRKQRGPANLWLTSAVAVIALALGAVAGRLSVPPPTLQGLLQPASLQLRQAAGALDIVELEYARALNGNAQSQAASLKSVAQAQQAVAAAELFRALYPQEIADVTARLTALEQAMRQRVALPGVTRQAEQVRTLLGALTTRVPR